MLNLIQHLRLYHKIAGQNIHDHTATEILNQVQDDMREYSPSGQL